MASIEAADPDTVLAGAVDQLVGRERTYVRAVLVARHGSVVVERYYRSTSPTDRADVHSVTKSVMSALIGIAIAEGRIPGVQATLAQLLPSYRDAMSPGMATVTLAQLLTMTSGLPEDPDTPQGIALVDGHDWVKDILGGTPTPSGTFRYSSAGSHLLSAILVEATGASTLSYARTSLFQPLGFDVPTDAAEPAWGPGIEVALTGPGFAWATDTEGIQMGYSGLKLSARELVQFGQLYLDGGRWGDQQIVPQAWVTESTRAQVQIPNATSDLALGYGYQWWVNQSSPHPGYAAVGFGGQRIFVIPDLDVVAVVTQDQAPTEYQADRIADDLFSTIAGGADAEPSPTTPTTK
jgi:CubicO group peptidase (beta-lactamase class C family)